MNQIKSWIRNTASSKSKMNNISKLLSYSVLALMAIIMILPLLWLINGSFQPSWQINADPVIWIPREWNTVRAGDSERKLYLWKMVTSPDEKQTEDVIQIGSRKYTSVVDAAKLQSVQSVPKDQLSEAIPVTENGITLNIRDWTTSEGVKKVVALAKDPEQENNLVVMELEGNQPAVSVYPLDQVNKGKAGKTSVGGYEFSVRQMEDGNQLIAIGPESELWVVGSPEIAKEARIVQSSQLGNKELINVGETQIPIYSVEGEPEDARFATIIQENWQPLMEQSLLAENAFVAQDADLSPEKVSQMFNGLEMTVRTYTPPDGGEPFDVVILTPGSTEYLVISTEFMDQLYAAPISELVEPGSVNISTLTYRVQEDFEKESRITPSALVGDIQDLAVIVPAAVVNRAQDVPPDQLSRSTRVKLNLNGYKKVLSLKLSGTPFYMFFVNSGYVVLMNIIGHFISCILVAYGFARFRAPGKNFFFLLLLGTMMVPGTIVTLPTYIIFRDLGLLGTMVPLWVRSFFGNAFLIFVLRQFFLTIPYDLDEAAILDGASRLQVLLKIIVPLSKPALAMIGIFTFWWYWNSFLDPLIYITTQKYYTISLALNSFNQLYSRSAGYYDRILAGSVLALLPMVVIFIFAQRYFIEGIQLQGIKR